MFTEFYQLYPTKRDKLKAQKAFNKLSEKDQREAIEGVKRETEYRRKMAEAKEWCPAWKHPTTWLNGHCWEDELILPEAQAEIERFDPILEDIKNLQEMQEEGTAIFANGKPVKIDGNQFYRTDIDNASRVNAYAYIKSGNKIGSEVMR